MSKIKGLIKSIIGTDAIIAIDANGNERSLKAGDVIYDNEVIKEQDGVKIEVQAAQTQNENTSDKASKEIASLQEELINGKNIADLEETAAGGASATGGGASTDGVSLGAASFANGGHYSNISANFSNLASIEAASAAGVTNVSGGASENFDLDRLAAAIDNAYNNILPETLEVSVTSVVDNVVTGNTNQAVSKNLDIEGNILEHENSQRTGLHITNDNTPTLSGKSTANVTISVFDGEGESAPILGTTTADNDGNWSYTPSSPLADGDHKFTIEASKVAANGEELKTTSTQEITVDTVNDQLTIDSISTDQFADLTKFNMFRTPNMETSHIDDSVLVNSWSDVDFTPTVSGKAEAFADVRIEV